MKNSLKIGLALVVLLAIGVAFFWDEIVFSKNMKKQYDNYSFRDDIVSDIVLINIGDGDREYLASLLDLISECHPAVIGADIFFPNPKDYATDVHLANSIGRSPTVLVMKSDSRGRNVIMPYDLFRKKAVGIGLPECQEHYGMTLTYQLYRNSKDSNKTDLEHYSITVARKYDSLKTETFIRKNKKNQEYFINYEVTKKNFQFYDYLDTTFNCAQINNKIVLLGYLGPTAEDITITPLGFIDNQLNYDKKKGDMYGVVVIANQILTILEDQELIEY